MLAIPMHRSTKTFQPSDEPGAERTSDGLPVAYAAQFGFALMGYLLIGMSLMLLAALQYDAAPEFRSVSTPLAAYIASLVVAIVCRIRMGWRGVLAGAITASLTLAVVGGALLVLMATLPR
jgi:hypothetical protein